MASAPSHDLESQVTGVDPMHPLLGSRTQNPVIQQAIGNTFKGTASLAKLLPTGTVLTFQFLSPAFTNHGSCDSESRPVATALMALCGASCVLHSFTDSFQDENHVVRYGIATPRGILVLDGGDPPPGALAAAYRLRFIDFLHAFMSLLVFFAVALFDSNVVSCFYPLPSEYAKNMLGVLPVCIGVLCSMMFVVFPTTRHGIGFPVAPHT